MINRRLAGVSATQVLILLAVALLVYLALGTASKVIRIYQLQQEEAQIRAEIEALKEKNRTLQQEKAYWQSDAAVEKVAREVLNLIKPGETGVVVVTTPQGRASFPAEGESAPKEDHRPNWLRWWDIFFGAPP